MGVFLASVMASILAAVILAATAEWWRETHLGVLATAAIRRLVPDSIRKNRNLLRSRTRTTQLLVKWLRSDQSTRGLHVGEYGRRAALEEERRFQDRVTDFAAKPRLYLTGWPCFVLHELRLGERQLSKAVAGMELLLASGPIQARATVASHPESVATVASLRHTFRAVQILHRLHPAHPIVVSFLGQMLDPHGRWRRGDGGWPQFDSDKRSDLWATAYAVALLHRVAVRRDVPVHVDEATIDSVLIDAINYLKTEWQRTGWKYAQASSPHNGVQIFHEVFECVRARDPEFLDVLRQWVLNWLTPAGTLGTGYLEACHSVTSASANARIGYALFQVAATERAWVPLFESSMRQLWQGLNSADAAFLLHMAQWYWTDVPELNKAA